MLKGGMFEKYKLKGSLTSVFACALLTLLSLSAVTAISMGIKPFGGGGTPPSGALNLFPAAECNVLESMEASREKLSESFSPLRPQGVWPWPDITGRFNINGVWLSESRGVYVVISQTSHPDSPRYGAISVRFYSSCNDKLVAQGRRVLAKEDWNSAETIVYLTRHGMRGHRLFAEVNVMMAGDERDTDNVAIRILELRRRTETRDMLFLGRFL